MRDDRQLAFVQLVEAHPGEPLGIACSGAHRERTGSRAANPITAWYREQCDGMVRVRGAGIEWVVLWRGLEPGEIAAAVDYCQRQPPDFVEAG